MPIPFNLAVATPSRSRWDNRERGEHPHITDEESKEDHSLMCPENITFRRRLPSESSARADLQTPPSPVQMSCCCCCCCCCCDLHVDLCKRISKSVFPLCVYKPYAHDRRRVGPTRPDYPSSYNCCESVAIACAMQWVSPKSKAKSRCRVSYTSVSFKALMGSNGNKQMSTNNTKNTTISNSNNNDHDNDDDHDYSNNNNRIRQSHAYWNKFKRREHIFQSWQTLRLQTVSDHAKRAWVRVFM